MTRTEELWDTKNLSLELLGVGYIDGLAQDYSNSSPL